MHQLFPYSDTQHYLPPTFTQVLQISLTRDTFVQLTANSFTGIFPSRWLSAYAYQHKTRILGHPHPNKYTKPHYTSVPLFRPLPTDTTTLEKKLATFDRNNDTQDTDIARSPAVHIPSITQHQGDTYNCRVVVLIIAVIYLHHDSPLTFIWHDIDKTSRTFTLHTNIPLEKLHHPDTTDHQHVDNQHNSLATHITSTSTKTSTF